MRSESNSSPRIVLILVIGLAVIGTGWAWRSAKHWKANQPIANFRAEVDHLVEIFHKYKKYVGEYPKGNHAEIARALQGENQKKVILILKKSDLNLKSEIVDPWGTPLKIYFANKEVLIRSTGPNKQFEDSKTDGGDDDVRSDEPPPPCIPAPNSPAALCASPTENPP